MVKKDLKERIAVIGLGVVGLPAALMLAKAGHKVLGVDTNKSIVNLLRKGVSPPQVKEKEFESFFKKNGARKNLLFQCKPDFADVFIIAVPTPLQKDKKIANLSFVKQAIESLIPFLEKDNLVIVESTIPPLTCRNFITPILEKKGFIVGKTIFLAHCPERILPGNIFHEIIHNDRVIGGINEVTRNKAQKVYSSFVRGRIFLTDDVSAELSKLMENAYRDVNIALANEFASVAENLGLDGKKVIEIANRHPRVNILNPSIGVGGHCIPIDPWFIHQVDKANSKLISLARSINDKMPMKIAEKIKREVKNNKRNKIVAVGASYKSDVSDIRESPAIKVVRLLKDEGFNILHYDPLVRKYNLFNSLERTCKKADLLVVLVPHKNVLEQMRTSAKKVRTLVF